MGCPGKYEPASSSKARRRRQPDFVRAPGKLRRVPLGGRPLAVAFLDGTHQAVVANYLLDNCRRRAL
jgi:hypothetical protein